MFENVLDVNLICHDYYNALESRSEKAVSLSGSMWQGSNSSTALCDGGLHTLT